MLNFIRNLFRVSSKKKLAELSKHVDAINQEFNSLANLSNDQLREKTLSLKQEIKQGMQKIQEKIDSLQEQAEQATELLIKEDLNKQIHQLEKNYNAELEKVLDQILIQAFAIIKETCRRFKENETVEVTASEYDKQLANECSHIIIEGDKAMWQNKWIVRDKLLEWYMIPYDVQLIGGILLHQGKIVEMATGEGKTLVATLPTFLNALPGKGVHIVTANNYLSRRDAEWMGPIYQFHGLTVDCIDSHTAHTPDRANSYKADITYGTNNEFGFDYLRDNMATNQIDVVQRGHNFAIIDEVDSILIDDARTPLIISGPSDISNEKDYHNLKPRVSILYEAQKKLVAELLHEAKEKIDKELTDEAGLALLRIYRGFPKFKPFIKFLSEKGIKKLLHKVENDYMQENFKMMPQADSYLYFIIDEKNNTINLTEKGIDLISTDTQNKDFFILPDIGHEIAGIEKSLDLSDEEKTNMREQLINDYNSKSQRIHIIQQLLRAYTLFEKDIDYVVENNKIKIVGEQTGRILEGRRYSDGLHQAIEAKEGVTIKKDNQTYATITLQNYFKMYHKLSGMTGTAKTDEDEFKQIYGLEVIEAPTNKPVIRKDKNDKIYKTAKEKFNAVINEVIELTNTKRPVLVCNTHVEASELVSKMLKIRRIPHQVLNAKNHQRESEIIAEAGNPGTVTVTTSMAARGTDIKLHPESKDNGGLAIIVTEHFESRSMDRQVIGRAGRQGDPGTSQFFVSLEDDLMRRFGSERIATIMDKMGLKEGEVIENTLVTRSIARAQKKIEQNNFAYRKRLLEYDNVVNIQRELIYKKRQNALLSNKIDLDIMSMIYDLAEQCVMIEQPSLHYNAFKLKVLDLLGIATKISEQDLQNEHKILISNLYKETIALYENKKNQIKSIIRSFTNSNMVQNNYNKTLYLPLYDGKKQIIVPLTISEFIKTDGDSLIRTIEKFVTLTFIDINWKKHLYMMDNLRQSVQNVVYEQKDPLLVYKIDAFELFKKLVSKLNSNIITYLINMSLLVDNTKATGKSSLDQPIEGLKENTEDHQTGLFKNLDQKPITSNRVIGRNDKVSVRYNNGTVKENVKFKNIEQDLINGDCQIIE
jgi:preprotein translocase subunit SecA